MVTPPVHVVCHHADCIQGKGVRHIHGQIEHMVILLAHFELYVVFRGNLSRQSREILGGGSTFHTKSDFRLPRR